MADPDADSAPEGWQVPQRIAFVAAALVPLTLLVVVVVAGWGYDRALRPARYRPVTTFPAPGVETFIHDGHRHPQPRTRRLPTEPDIAVAKRQVAAGGLAGWAARP